MRQLAWRLSAGLVWLAMVAAQFSSLTESNFLLMFAAVVTGTLFTCGLALAWLTRWALREDSRPGQFSIGSLLFLTAFVAIYLGAVRWLVSHLPRHSSRTAHAAFVEWSLPLYCLLLALVSAPIVFGMLDVLLRLAVWSVGYSPIRSLLKVFFRRRR